MLSSDGHASEEASPASSIAEGHELASRGNVTLHLDVRATLPWRTGRIIQRLLNWAERHYTFDVTARRVTARTPTPAPVPVSLSFTVDLVPEESTVLALEQAPVLVDIGDDVGRDPLALFHTEGASAAECPPDTGPVFFPEPQVPPLTTGFRLPGPAGRSLSGSLVARYWTRTLAHARAWYRAGVRTLDRVPALQAATAAISASARRLARPVRVAASWQAAWTPVLAVAAPVRRSGEVARGWLDAKARAAADALDARLSALDGFGPGAAIAAGVGAAALTIAGVVLIVASQSRETAGPVTGPLDDRVQALPSAVDSPPTGTSDSLVVVGHSAMADLWPDNEVCWLAPPAFQVTALSGGLPTLNAFGSELEEAVPYPTTGQAPSVPATAPTNRPERPTPPPRRHSSNAFVGTIEISSTPVGALVIIDGVTHGPTPLEIRGVQAGAHAVRVELDGYERWTKAVSVASGGRVRLLPVMRPLDIGASLPE